MGGRSCLGFPSDLDFALPFFRTRGFSSTSEKREEKVRSFCLCSSVTFSLPPHEYMPGASLSADTVFLLFREIALVP